MKLQCPSCRNVITLDAAVSEMMGAHVRNARRCCRCRRQAAAVTATPPAPAPAANDANTFADRARTNAPADGRAEDDAPMPPAPQAVLIRRPRVGGRRRASDRGRRGPDRSLDVRDAGRARGAAILRGQGRHAIRPADGRKPRSPRCGGSISMTRIFSRQALRTTTSISGPPSMTISSSYKWMS